MVTSAAREEGHQGFKGGGRGGGANARPNNLEIKSCTHSVGSAARRGGAGRGGVGSDWGVCRGVEDGMSRTGEERTDL